MPTAATTNLTIATLLDLTAALGHAPATEEASAPFDALLQPPQRPREQPHENSSPLQTAATKAHSPQVSSTATETPLTAAAPSRAAADEDLAPPADSSETSDDAPSAAQSLIEKSLAALSLQPAVVPAPPAPSSDAIAEPAVHEEEPIAKGKAPKRSAAKSPLVATEHHSTAIAEAAGAAHLDEPVAPAPAQQAGNSLDSPPQSAAAAPVSAADASLAVTASSGDVSPDALGVLPPAEPSQDATSAAEQPAELRDALASGTNVAQSPSPGPETHAAGPLNQQPPPSAAPLVAPIAAQPPQATVPVSSPNTATGAVASTPPAGRNRLASHVLAQADGPAPRRGISEADAKRLLGRVARAFAAAQERDGEVRLRLSPAELGSLRLEIRVQDGAMVAHLEAETEAARTAIVENLPALRERLAEQGVRIERFDVDLMQRHPTGTPNHSSGGQHEAPSPAPRSIAPVQRAAPAAAHAAASPSTQTTSGGLNVIV